MLSNSWVVTRRDTGAVVGEFYDARVVAKFNPERVTIETAHEYLSRISNPIRVNVNRLED